MAYSDPMSITVSGSAKSLNRTGFGPSSGSFQTSDGDFVVTVSHLYGKRYRRMIKLTQNKISADALVPDQNVRSTASVHLVADVPVNGFTTAEVKALADGFLAYLSASSGAALTKLLGGEV